MLAVVTLACCGGGDRVLEGRSYVGQVNGREVLGRWSPRPAGARATLELQADGNCAITAGAINMLVNCEHTEPVGPVASGDCGWNVEGKPGEQWLAITFHSPRSGWVVTHFSVYQHQGTGELALAGTCAEGDAYGLYRETAPRPVK